MDSEQKTIEAALRFLAQARGLAWWKDNQDVLAPNERTPYLDTVAMVPILLLAQSLPGAEVVHVRCGARAVPGKTSIPSRSTSEWLLRWGKHCLGIEGVTGEDQAKAAVLSRWNMGRKDGKDDAPGNYEVVVRTEVLSDERTCRHLMRADPVLAKLVGDLQEPLATLITGPLLDAMTVSAPPARPASRRI